MSRFNHHPPFAFSLALSAALALFAAGSPALAQGVTAQQQATADKVAEAGIPLSELAANAPDSHTVKRGDTLWGHLQAVSQVPLALARVVGHEQGRRSKPAPDLPRAGVGAGTHCRR